MTDKGPSSDDISELWGEKPDLTPAPLRRAEPAPPGDAADPVAVIQGELRRLQAVVAALDPASLRRETGTALETGLAAVESRLGRRLDELTRSLDEVTEIQAAQARELASLSSAKPAGDEQPTGRHRSWRSRREHEAASGPVAADPDPPAAGDVPVAGVEARLGGRLDELADLVEGLVRRLPGRSAASEPPPNGQQPVEQPPPPVV